MRFLGTDEAAAYCSYCSHNSQPPPPPPPSPGFGLVEKYAILVGGGESLRPCVFAPGGCSAFRSNSNGDVLTHPARATGDTHRMDLSHMVMLKDNHIWSTGRCELPNSGTKEMTCRWCRQDCVISLDACPSDADHNCRTAQPKK